MFSDRSTTTDEETIAAFRSRQKRAHSFLSTVNFETNQREFKKEAGLKHSKTDAFAATLQTANSLTRTPSSQQASSNNNSATAAATTTFKFMRPTSLPADHTVTHISSTSQFSLNALKAAVSLSSSNDPNSQSQRSNSSLQWKNVSDAMGASVHKLANILTASPAIIDPNNNNTSTTAATTPTNTSILPFFNSSHRTSSNPALNNHGKASSVVAPQTSTAAAAAAEDIELEIVVLANHEEGSSSNSMKGGRSNSGSYNPMLIPTTTTAATATTAAAGALPVDGTKRHSHHNYPQHHHYSPPPPLPPSSQNLRDKMVPASNAGGAPSRHSSSHQHRSNSSSSRSVGDGRPSTPKIEPQRGGGGGGGGRSSDEDDDDGNESAVASGKRRIPHQRQSLHHPDDVVIRMANASTERTNSLGGGGGGGAAAAAAAAGGNLFATPLAIVFGEKARSFNNNHNAVATTSGGGGGGNRQQSPSGRKGSLASTSASEGASRRTSPWRLFDVNTPGDNPSSSAAAAGAAGGGGGGGGFLVSKVDSRRSIGNRIRTMSTHGLTDAYSPTRRKTGSRGSLATPTTATQNVVQNFQTMTTSVGEIMANLIRPNNTQAAIAAATQNTHMSAFESDIRNVSRDSVAAQTNNSTKNSNSNVSFAGYSRQERKGSFAESSQARKSNGSGSIEDLEADRQSLIQTIPHRHLKTIRSKNSLDLNNLNQLLNAKIQFVPSSGGLPISTFSVLCSIENQPKEKKRKTKSIFGSQPFGDRLGFAIDAVKRKTKVESYQRLIEPTGTLGNIIPDYDIYNPFSLDDPELKTGKHRTVIKLQSYVSSILLYSRPTDIKKELNEVFRETHPTVDPTLMLSQIRSLKQRMINVGKSVNMELSSVACAIVYFEKLVFKKFATRENRRLIASVCLLLAAKVNDPKEFNYTQLLEAVETIMLVPPKEVFQQEFATFVALEFTLFIPLWQLMPHLERIIEVSDYKSLKQYLGGRNFFKVKS